MKNEFFIINKLEGNYFSFILYQYNNNNYVIFILF